MIEHRREHPVTLPDSEVPTATRFAHTLSFLLLEMRGGVNRTRILLLLQSRPKNAHTIARELGLNYGTVVSHLRALLRYGIVATVGEGRYARGYTVSPDLGRNREVLDQVCRSLRDRR